MGFFSWLMKGVDIQSENENIQQQKSQNQVNIPTQHSLTDNQFESLQQLSKKEKEVTFCVEPIQSQPVAPQIDNRLGLNSEKYAPRQEYQSVERQKAELLVFKVGSIKDIQAAIRHLGKAQPCIIDIVKLSKKEKAKLLDYLGGAIFALKGTMHKFKKENYVLSPEGMTISLQEKIKTVKR